MWGRKCFRSARSYNCAAVRFRGSAGPSNNVATDSECIMPEEEVLVNPETDLPMTHVVKSPKIGGSVNTSRI